MKKILIFSLAYFPKHVGGAEVAIKEITDRINPKEIEFHMVTLRFDSTLPEKEKIGNVLVHRIGWTKENPSMAELRKFPLHLNKLYFQLAAARKASALHKENHYDALWAMMAHSCGIPAALFKLFRPRVPLVLTLQEGDPIPHIKRKVRLAYPLFKRAFTQADVVQAISTYLGRWAWDMGFKGPLEVIPNAVNTEHFSQKYAEGELVNLKEKLGKRVGDIYLITTSRLVPKNGIKDVIDALPHLSETVKFLILGTGPLEEELQKRTKELSLEGRVMFLGQIDHKELPKFLQISDIFIRPSLSEGMGNSFVEAMAAGLPVIATQEGGIADFLFDPELNPAELSTGKAVDPHDPEGIARAVTWFLENPKETQRIVKNAERLALKKYDWKLIARDMKNRVFNKVLKNVDNPVEN